MPPAIDVRDLRKSYPPVPKRRDRAGGNTVALRGIHFSIERGEFYGLRYSVLGVGDSPFHVSLMAALAMTTLFSAVGVFLFHKGYRIKT